MMSLASSAPIQFIKVSLAPANLRTSFKVTFLKGNAVTMNIPRVHLLHEKDISKAESILSLFLLRVCSE